MHAALCDKVGSTIFFNVGCRSKPDTEETAPVGISRVALPLLAGGKGSVFVAPGALPAEATGLLSLMALVVLKTRKGCKWKTFGIAIKFHV